MLALDYSGVKFFQVFQINFAIRLIGYKFAFQVVSRNKYPQKMENV